MLVTAPVVWIVIMGVSKSVWRGEEMNDVAVCQ